MLYEKKAAANNQTEILPDLGGSGHVDKLRWLVTIPVLKERALLRRCLEGVIPVASREVSIVVALDGKHVEDVYECESEVQDFISRWRYENWHLVHERIKTHLEKLDTEWRTRLTSYLLGREALAKMAEAEDHLVESYLQAESDGDASTVEAIWSSINPIVSLPTTVSLASPADRRKAEALNVIIALAGKRCLWLRYSNKEFLVAGNSASELKKKYEEICCSFGAPVGRRLVVVPASDILFCVDVDEQLNREAFARLKHFVEINREYHIVQTTKRDIPVARTPSARAFHSIYTSWFRLEAGWVPSRSFPKGLRCSYYGSLAAVRLLPELLEQKVVKLAHGDYLNGQFLFPEGFCVEDYPLFVKKYLTLNTLLLKDSVGCGETPNNAQSLFSLWARWTHANVSVFVYWTSRRILSGSASAMGAWGVLALVYHGLSWFAYANVLITSTLIAVYALSAPPTLDVLTSSCIAMTIITGFLRPIATTPGVPLGHKFARYVLEYMLSPISLYYTCCGLLSPFFKLTQPPIATPRAVGRPRLSGWVSGVYFLNCLLLVSAAMLAIKQLHEASSLPLQVLFIAAIFNCIRFMVGLILLSYEKYAVGEPKSKQPFVLTRCPDGAGTLLPTTYPECARYIMPAEAMKGSLDDPVLAMNTEGGTRLDDAN